MKINKVVLVCFSPTGGTEHVAELLAERLGLEIEKTDIHARCPRRSFGPDELAIFAFPVYGGRIPAPVYEHIKELRGENTPAFMLAVYGNRAVDDANLEMADLAEEKGFVCIGGAEFITRHSVDVSYGSGRPDGEDLKLMDELAEKLKEKLSSADKPEHIELPGSRPYTQYGGIPIKPSGKKSACIKCGKCVSHCPAGAISADTPFKTDKKKCISCMGCISICPSGARYISAPFRLAGRLSLKKLCSERQNPQYYI